LPQTSHGHDPNAAKDQVDFFFAENGLVAYKEGKILATESLKTWLGEDKLKELLNYILHYVADLDIPIKRGTFIEFRNGMLNVSPIGRNCSQEERDEFERFDQGAGVRYYPHLFLQRRCFVMPFAAFVSSLQRMSKQELQCACCMGASCLYLQLRLCNIWLLPQFQASFGAFLLRAQHGMPAFTGRNSLKPSRRSLAT